MKVFDEISQTKFLIRIGWSDIFNKYSILSMNSLCILNGFICCGNLLKLPDFNFK